MNCVVCENLSKTYKSEAKQALDSVTFSVPSNGIFALIGRNGAGKTTLVRILATELMPSSGYASINGLDVVKDAGKLRDRIAIVPQEARPIPWMTPKQTISSYLLWRGFKYKAAEETADEYLAKVGIDDKSDNLNRTLSGGIKRKLMAATVLASGAPIIFLDEPTTGLDPISRKEFWKLLKEMGRDHFIVLTTHYLEEAEELASMIGILDQGRMLCVDTLDRLRLLIKHQYIVRVKNNSAAEKIIRSSSGEIVEGDTDIQLFTSEDDAIAVSKRLIEIQTRFSINPVSLDDVFFYFVDKGDREG